MARIKIRMTTDKPDITEEEIRNSMNFDQVLNLAKTSLLNKQKRIRRFKTGLYMAGIALIGITAYWQWKPDTIREPLANRSSESLLPPAPATDSINSEAPAQVKAPQELTGKKQEKTKTTEPAKAAPLVVVSDSLATAYVPAEPIDGFPALYEYFNRELNYPKEALKDSTQGVITVNFMINQRGEPKDLKIANSLGPAFDKEAVRLIEKMPPWKPASLAGKPVDSKISIPLTFQIKTFRKPK